MSCSNNNCNNGYLGNQSLPRHLYDFIGQTVTIFTTSGGVSGCGFTGVILSVNCNFVRLVTMPGTAPANPLSESICGDFDDAGNGGIGGGMGGGIGGGIGGKMGCLGGGVGGGVGGGIGGGGGRRPSPSFNAGSVCDIPIDKIAAFCHNAV